MNLYGEKKIRMIYTIDMALIYKTFFRFTFLGYWFDFLLPYKQLTNTQQQIVINNFPCFYFCRNRYLRKILRF